MLAWYRWHPYELQAFLAGASTGAFVVGNAWLRSRRRNR